MMWVAIAASGYALRHRLPILGVVMALGLAGTAYILGRVPTRERVVADRA